MAGSSVQSVERAFGLVELLCKNGAMGITELAAESGLNKATVFRLLSTLSGLGYVAKNPSTEKYELTLRFLRLSAGSLSKIDIRRYARKHLERIAELTGETVHLVERNGNEIVYIDKFESARNSVRMVSRVGLSMPLVYTAVGKAIMARLGDEEIRRIWGSTEIIRKTEHTITDYEQFKAEINKVRALGYATDLEENENGVCCVAAALDDVYGEYKYAFSVSAPTSRMDEHKLKKVSELVRATAEKISNDQ